MHSIWAARTVLTAKVKDALRKTLNDSDRILVVEVSAGWASRRAENNVGVTSQRGSGSRAMEAALGRMSEPKTRVARFAAMFR